MSNSKSALEELTELLNAYPVTSYSKLHCIDNSKNQYKFYVLKIEPDGQDTFSLTVHYGRIGSSKMVKKYLTQSSEKACRKKAEMLYNQKIKKGYKEVAKGYSVEQQTDLNHRI